MWIFVFTGLSLVADRVTLQLCGVWSFCGQQLPLVAEHRGSRWVSAVATHRLWTTGSGLSCSRQVGSSPTGIKAQNPVLASLYRQSHELATPVSKLNNGPNMITAFHLYQINNLGLTSSNLNSSQVQHVFLSLPCLANLQDNMIFPIQQSFLNGGDVGDR